MMENLVRSTGQYYHAPIQNLFQNSIVSQQQGQTYKLHGKIMHQTLKLISKCKTSHVKSTGTHYTYTKSLN